MLSPQSPLKKPVTAVSRAAHILRYLGRVDAPAGVNTIARDLDIIPSTCLHILRTLSHEGLTAFDPATKRYRLGSALLSLSRDALANSDFVREAKPRMDDLAERHGVTMTATELDSTEHMVVVSIARARQILSIHVNVGSRFPALISASGRCYAAQNNWTQKELRPRFRALRWQNPPIFKDWFREVAIARHDGYAIDRGHYIRGLLIAAAPVLGGEGPVIRAIAAIGFAEQLNGKKELQLARDVKEAAEQLSA
jgi:DNA-binding IclR family transcriptional regulator